MTFALSRSAALLAFALALAAPPSHAADKRSSISVFGNLTFPDSGGTNGTVFLSFGQLVGSSIELEGGVGQTYSKSSGSDTTLSSLTFGAKYYFTPVGKAGGITPYLKLGVVSNRSSDVLTPDSSGVQGGGGLEFAFNESASTFFEAVYSQNKNGTVTIRSGNTTTTYGGDTTKSTTLNLGIKVRF